MESTFLSLHLQQDHGPHRTTTLLYHLRLVNTKAWTPFRQGLNKTSEIMLVTGSGSLSKHISFKYFRFFGGTVFIKLIDN